nr:NADH-plastoquinone oxidoreductase subunit I [Malania oleifera]UYG49746.1 NADH-plastoquinone oxidoreductase subunit I [Malania oleifera]
MTEERIYMNFLLMIVTNYNQMTFGRLPMSLIDDYTI